MIVLLDPVPYYAIEHRQAFPRSRDQNAGNLKGRCIERVPTLVVMASQESRHVEIGGTQQHCIRYKFRHLGSVLGISGQSRSRTGGLACMANRKPL